MRPLEDNELWAIIWIGILLTLIFALTLLTVSVYKSKALYVENGYEMVVVPGRAAHIWQKSHGWKFDDEK